MVSKLEKRLGTSKVTSFALVDLYGMKELASWLKEENEVPSGYIGLHAFAASGALIVVELVE